MGEIITPHGFDRPQNETIIWRYMSFSRFADLISTSELYLARLDKFWDFNEGGMTRKMQKDSDKQLGDQGAEDLHGIMQWSNQFITSRAWYASCWNAGNHEYYLMWRTYGTEVDPKSRTMVP